MRSQVSHTITSREVHQWALEWLLAAGLLKDHGWLCTASVVGSIVLRAAARMTSLSTACCDLAEGPSCQAVLNALRGGLPKTPSVLERRLNQALAGWLPRSLSRRRWPVAIDWHLTPYYGQPHKSRNELYYGKPRQGTKQFHAYASACIVEHGQRYTLATIGVRRHETTVAALRRLLALVRQREVKIRHLLLDRAFCNLPVVEYLQQERLPFLMPVMFRGRPPKKRPRTGLRWLQRQRAGWYSHTLQNGKRQATIRVCVTYRTHRQRKDRKRVQQKLLFAAWRVQGTPREIKERYRRRFGIEASFRQLRQARIYTCTRDPRLRLVFIVIALLLRNLWVWLHATRLADRTGPQRSLRLDRLRFKRLLDWIAHEVLALFHPTATSYVEFNT